LTYASSQVAFLADVNQAGAAANKALVRQQWTRNRKSLQPESLDAPQPLIGPAATASLGKVVDALKLYGQALEALATDNATGTLDQNAKNVASGLQGFDKSVLQPVQASGKPILSSTQIDGVVTGVTKIADFVIGRIIAKNVQHAAQERRDDIKAIVGALKRINTSYGDLSSNEFSVFRGANLEVLRTPGSNLGDFNNLTAELAQARGQTDPAKVNAALDALERANSAVADAGPGGALAQVQAFVQAATDAYNFYTNLAK
jgi:hypothetical protein